MHRKLVVTLSTVHGSRQITLSQITRYFVLSMLIVAAIAFALAYYLLFKVSESLEVLEQEHYALNTEYDTLNYELEQVSEQRDVIKARYDIAIGSQRLYLNELDALNDKLLSISQEREVLLEQTDELSQQLSALDQVEAEKYTLEIENNTLEVQNDALTLRLEDLSESLGLGALQTNLSLEEQANLLEATARQRLFLMHSIPNGIPGESVRVNSHFGPRTHPTSGKSSMHRGIDLKMPTGTPIYATADGIVETAGTDTNGGFGKLIRIQHSFGFRTYYAHLSKIQVEVGQYVRKGEQIALSGNTGRSTGPHLHYEVRRLWTAMDPEPFMNWSLGSYDQIFTTVSEVDWESLGKLYPLRTAQGL